MFQSVREAKGLARRSGISCPIKQFPVTKGEDTIGVGRSLVAMSDQDQVLAILASEAVQEGHHLPAGSLIQIASGFVGKN
jgi:hypothetical protein